MCIPPVSQLKLHMQVVHLWYLFKLTVPSVCQAVMQPFGFPQLKDFPLCHTMQMGWKKKGWKQVYLSLCEYFTSKSDEGLSETCLPTCHSHKTKWNLHASLKTGMLCAKHDFHALILNNLWEIVNMMTCDSFHSLHREIQVAATIIYSLKQTPAPVYDGCLEIRGAENKLFCAVEMRQHRYNLHLSCLCVLHICFFSPWALFVSHRTGFAGFIHS